jgi:hypothetical protein
VARDRRVGATSAHQTWNWPHHSLKTCLFYAHFPISHCGEGSLCYVRPPTRHAIAHAHSFWTQLVCTKLIRVFLSSCSKFSSPMSHPLHHVHFGALGRGWSISSNPVTFLASHSILYCVIVCKYLFVSNLVHFEEDEPRSSVGTWLL